MHGMATKKYYQTPEFLALQEKWYKKLESEGHEDIEVIDPTTGDPYPYLHSTRGCYNSSGDALRKYKPSQEAYYELARAHFWKMVASEEEMEMFRLYAFRAFRVSKISRLMGVSYNKVKKFIKEQEDLFLPPK